jgi:hypothetical protein
VDREVGRVEIDYDRLGSVADALDEDAHYELLDRNDVEREPLVAIALRTITRRKIETAEGAFARQERARIGLAREGCEQRIVAQRIMIGEFIVARAQFEPSLRRRFPRRVLDTPKIAMIELAGREALDDHHSLVMDPASGCPL